MLNAPDLPLDPVHLTRYLDRIRGLHDSAAYSTTELLRDDFLLASEGDLSIYFAPFDWVNSEASVSLVGITPGWTQMEKSFQVFKGAVTAGLTSDEALAVVKKEAAFAGSMRSNLLSMLDEIGLPAMLGIERASALFIGSTELVHSTSAIRYPAFVNGSNYSGHRPTIEKSPLLKRFVREVLSEELNLAASALVVPLGGAVEGALRVLVERNSLDERRVLFGFPHPSGGNGHRQRQFAERRSSLRRKAALWL